MRAPRKSPRTIFRAGSGALRSLCSQIEDIGHPGELGERMSLHLPHQVGAMHLHSGLGDANIVGNLLVQTTGHDMEQDLTLAQAERLETLPERSRGRLTLPSGTIARKPGSDRLNKLLITERFCQELYRTALHRLDGHR